MLRYILFFEKILIFSILELINIFEFSSENADFGLNDHICKFSPPSWYIFTIKDYVDFHKEVKNIYHKCVNMPVDMVKIRNICLILFVGQEARITPKQDMFI